MMSPLCLISMPGAAELIIISIVLLSLIFWIAAIVDIAKSRFDSDTNKVVWLLIVIFLGIIGAAIYYFAGRKSKIQSS
jgi:hypothetical protein